MSLGDGGGSINFPEDGDGGKLSIRAGDMAIMCAGDGEVAWPLVLSGVSGEEVGKGSKDLRFGWGGVDEEEEEEEDETPFMGIESVDGDGEEWRGA